MTDKSDTGSIETGHDPTQSERRGGHRLVDPQPVAGHRRGDYPDRRRVAGGTANALGCHSRPVRYPGDHPYRLCGAVATDCRRSGDLPPVDRHARAAEDRGRARLLHVWHQFRLCDLPGRRGPVLGTLAGHRGPVHPGRFPARHGAPADRPGRHRGRLGLSIWLGGSNRAT